MSGARLRPALSWAIGAVALAGFALWLVTLLPIADPLPPPLQGWRTVGSYFDRPPSWPGKPWTKDGRTVGWGEMQASAGPSHCGLDSLTFLDINWPLGTSNTTSGEQQRQYIRDPSRKLQPNYLLGSWARNPTLPADARDTGYRYGALKLYLAHSDENRYTYLVAPADSERWPRSDPGTTCS